MMPAQLSVLIPVHNEELNLENCLASLVGWASEIFVVDSHSTDGTVEIAKRYGANVVRHVYEGPAKQKNWALDNLQFAHDWVLILDGDERVSPELRDEITEIVAENGKEHDGYYLNRRFMFYGKWIKHCGWYPSWNLRLFKHRMGRYENRRIHEHLILKGSVAFCKHDMVHEDLRDMACWIAKHNDYSTFEVHEINRFQQQGDLTGFQSSWRGSSPERKRFIKQRIWPYLPGRALLFFFYLFIFRLGFLDGKRGFIFCVMHAIFEEFNTVKLWELKHYKKNVPPSGGICVPKVIASEGSTEISGPGQGQNG